MATAVSTTTLTITTAPTMQQLHDWWKQMHTDPDDLHVAFNDFTPTTLHAFLRQDLLLALCHFDETIAAAAWLHDLTRDAQGLVVEGWIGGWVAKPCRGQIGMASWQLTLDYLVERGVAHIHSAINVANRRSFLFTKRLMGFTAVGVFPRLSPFRGVRTDMHILTLHAADRERAWRAAEVLAQQRWSAHEAPRQSEATTEKLACLLETPYTEFSTLQTRSPDRSGVVDCTVA